MLKSIKEKIRRLKCRVKAAKNNKPFEEYKIHSDSSEYLKIEKSTIYGENEITIIPWNDINLAGCFTWDCFIGEKISIFMITEMTDDSGVFWVDEGMEGWKSLLPVLPKRLPPMPGYSWSDADFPDLDIHVNPKIKPKLIYKNPNTDQEELDKIIKGNFFNG